MDNYILREAGLTEGEIKVYIGLLKIGLSTTGPIVDESKVSKSIIYQILEKLIEKGLVSYIIKDKTKYFQAAHPNSILKYIDKKEESLKETKKEIEALLPQMIADSLRKESSAQIFQGPKGIQTVHEKTYLKLKKGEEYVYLGISPVQDEIYHLYWERDHKKREKAGIKCRLLFNQGTDMKILKNRNKFKLCDARYMPIEAITPAWFLIYREVVVIGLQSEEAIAIEIVNEDISKSFKEYFEYFWRLSKPFKIKKASS